MFISLDVKAQETYYTTEVTAYLDSNGTMNLLANDHSKMTEVQK